MRRLTVLLLLAACTGAASAQVTPGLYDFTRTDLTWYTIETEHFKVHFHADSAGTGSSRTAQAVARIAEDVYGPITSLYGREPDEKVSFILKDFEDYSNGGAYFFDNMIEIWAPSLNTPLRGDHAWLRNVITHEFTHIVQVQRTMKATRRIPFLYLQVLDYEDVRRPDVLYGYPNFIASYAVPVLSNPAWLAEGTAQYQRTELFYDRWDSHRDMLLRTRSLAGSVMTLEAMGGFYSHTSLGRESVYNHGFALSQYIATRFGEDALADVSTSLSRWSNWNFERASREALGLRGEALHADWVEAMQTGYAEALGDRLASPVEGTTIEPDGFLNLFPSVSPDGRRVVYLSNKGGDFSRQYLYVRDLADPAAEAVALAELPASEGTVCSLGHRIAGPAGGAVSWRPDGGAVVFARVLDTPTGHLYSDLFAVELASKKVDRLTRELRVSDPSWSPDGLRIAVSVQRDGTTNLALVDPETGGLAPVTDFRGGEQVTEPSWDPSGDWIYFGRQAGHGRDLYRVRPDGSGLEPVIATDADERSPAFDADGRLHYASDADGIFNLYRTGDAGPERLTNVAGGAFMPAPAPSGGLVFARFDWDGYHLAALESPEPLPAAVTYRPPPMFGKQTAKAVDAGAYTGLNAANDADLRAFEPSLLRTARDSGRVALADLSGGDPSVLSPYSNTYTAFSFLPVLRLDQYVSRRRSRTEVRLRDRTVGETLLRNLKVGAYVTSREIMNGLTMFGGFMVSPASRPAASFGDYVSPVNLLKLERDLFLQFEYRRGLGVLPRRWSPQFTLELFNVRRNVEKGLSIEEFPCTACYPDTTLADLAYNLWEVDFAVRAKVSRALLLEVGARYSPYRVTTERFFSRELRQTIPESSSRYFIGRGIRAKAYFESLVPHRHDDVLPEGVRAELTIERERGRLLRRFDVEDGVLNPVYEDDVLYRLTADVRAGVRLQRSAAPHGLSVRLRTSVVPGRQRDDFYDDYVGGLTGARGYPFYALGGNKSAWVQAAYTLPLLPDVGRQLGFLYVDKVYARVYADAVAAWSGAWKEHGAVRRDAGLELRFGLGSFYLLPTAFFVSGTYGLDAFDFQLDEGFVTPDGRSTVRYGRGLQWHAGVLFGFDLL